MLAVITCGTLIFFSILLYMNRHRINPRAKDELTKRRVREADRSLDAITFLFKDFKPSCLYMEPIELLRRVTMIGGVRFIGEGGLRCGVSAMLSLMSVFLYREVAPYTNKETNALASAVNVVVFFVYIAAFVIVTKPVRTHTLPRGLYARS